MKICRMGKNLARDLVWCIGGLISECTTKFNFDNINACVIFGGWGLKMAYEHRDLDSLSQSFTKETILQLPW